MPIGANPKVDLVTVVSHESTADLVRFGRALGGAWAALPPERRGRSIMVENTNDAAVLEVAASALTDAVDGLPHRIRLEGGGGPARAYNRGLREVDAAYVCLLDPDGTPERDTLALLVDALDANPRAALAAAAVVPFGTLSQSHAPPLEVEWASAGATLYRAEALIDVGGFDELFAYSCEEMDLGYRCRKAGWTCLRVPAAAFHHEVEHKVTWLRTLRYLEYLMAWRHIHFSRTITAKSWLMQIPYLVALGRRSGWRVAGGGMLGLLAYLRHVPACERRR